jgi:hypothetical protein
MRAKNGNVEEWVRWIDHKGTMYWCGHDKKSGLKCKIVYEKFCCMEGSWKPVSLMGYEKLASAMGKFLDDIVINIFCNTLCIQFQDLIRKLQVTCQTTATTPSGSRRRVAASKCTATASTPRTT